MIAGPGLCCRRRVRQSRQPEDPHRQWVWAYIEAVAQLVEVFVSIFDYYVCFCLDSGAIA